MIGFIRRFLGFSQVDTTPDAVDHNPLFSGYACFSKLVPQAVVQKWVAFGGEVYMPRSPFKATYFFATDVADKWVTALTSRSVTVIHAVWIMHCIEHGFQVPIAEYVFDGITIPRISFKLIHGLAAPNSGADRVTEARRLAHEALYDQPNESLHPRLVQLDTLSTPPNMLRKRKREPSYFDSPTRSFVFSEFDKDGVPQRPRKQRRLRLSPSFNPEREKANVTLTWPGISSTEMTSMSGTDAAVEGRTVANDVIAGIPNQLSLYAAEGPQGPFVAPKGFQDCLHFALGPFPTTAKHLRTIDFTRFPSTRRRFQFPGSTQLQPRESNPNLSTVKLSDKIGVASGDTADTKPARKITFASHASVRLYRARSGTEVLQEDGLKSNVNTAQGPINKLDDEQHLEAPKAPVLTNAGPLAVQCETEEATSPELILVHERNAVNAGDTYSHISDLFAGATDTSTNSITLETAQMLDYRTKLLRSHPSDGCLGNGKLATLFEVGKSCRGMEFRHEW